ncbi:carboxypeptidase-like regulatory domain-containing protein [Oleiharenicola sp. Vm1]|uniref:TonB-dependent receptor n=1 Tax=Oleiharenicola sp. Vm1 TaxID=3398393 RepID=UPI0039F56F6D
MKLHLPTRALVALVSLACTIAAFAQTAGTGTITGHVYNAVTKEYTRDATVRVEGTDLSVVSETSGYFSLQRVPVGEVTVTVTYIGLPPVSQKVTVVAGETTNQEFELGGAAAAAKSGEAVVQLQTFTVTAEKDGNAKALSRQKNSMNLSRSVASDAFGNITEGNVGEFLKFLPGVELEYVEADTRGPRIGGMSSEYASVTLDGKSIASADSFGQYVGFENSASGTANRSFGFDSISINSIESIEINRVTSAAMDANAPAGNINLKTKKAFDRKGRYFGGSISTVLNSQEFGLGATPGPGDRIGRKWRPNFNATYSDIFFNNRLGIILSLQESNLYNEQYRVDHSYNRTPTATDTRAQVLTQVLLKDGPKWTNRGSYTATFDFRATPNLTLSLNALFSRYHAQFYNRQVTMIAGGTRATVPGDGVLTYGSSPTNAGSIQFGGGNGAKFTNTLTFSPSFEYRRENLRVDGSFTTSHSRNDYDNLAHKLVANTTVNNVTGIGFTATRSAADSADWKITQTGGSDWTNLALQTNPRISDDNRQNTIDIKSGDLNARYNLPFRLPSFIQVGAKRSRNAQFARNSNDSDKWLYVGPGGGTTGSFANYPSPFTLFGGGNQPGVVFTSLSGGGAPPFPDRDTLGELFHTHPEYFVRTLPTSATGSSTAGISLANYESGTYLNQPTYDVKETVTAGYIMGNTRLSKLALQGGVRYELTEIDSTELDPYSNQDVAAAGYPVTSTGAPNSVSAIDYKYSRPRVQRHGDYADYFPSATAKYSILPNLLFDIGWGKTIRRPDLGKISGTRQINDDALQVTTPNPNLLPERSKKMAASLSYFFGSTGVNNLQVVASRNKVTNKTLQKTLTSEEFGNTDPNYDGYDFVSYSSAPLPITYSSMEYSYQQYLNFLPKIMQGTSLTASYTRTYVETPPAQVVLGVIPHTLKGTLGYRNTRLNLSFSAIWQDDSGPFQAANRYQKRNVKCDLSGAITINDRLQFFFSGRNIFETPHLLMEKSAGNPDVLFRYENYGTNWTFGIKGSF